MIITVTRKERFLNAAITQTPLTEGAVTRIEMYLDAIANGSADVPTPITRVEQYLAKIAGADAEVPTPVTRIEMYLAKVAGEDIEPPTPVTRIEQLLAGWEGGGADESNLLEMTTENVVLGKYINNSGQVQTSDPNFYYSKSIPVGALDTITLTCSESLNYVSIMEYDANGTFVKRTLYGGTGASAVGKSLTHIIGTTTATILWGSNPNGSKVTTDILHWKWKMTVEPAVNLLDWQQSNIKSNYYINSSGAESFNNYYFYYTPYVDVTDASKVIITCSTSVKILSVSEYSGDSHTFVKTTSYSSPGTFVEHICAAGTNEIRWSCDVSNLTGAWSYVNQFSWALYKG